MCLLLCCKNKNMTPNHPIIADLNWRYATKKFDSTQKISAENIEIIKESLRLTPSSLGLQPLKFLFIETPELREKLKEKGNNQSQITDASHLIVICAYKEINHDYIDKHMANTAATRGQEVESLAGFSNHVKNYVGSQDAEKVSSWNSKQAYIALGQLLHTCATLRIDATPMEGFDPAGFDEILELGKDNLQSILVCPIGYRAEDDKYVQLKKVRKSHEDLFETR
jgi:nitroreductase